LTNTAPDNFVDKHRDVAVREKQRVLIKDVDEDFFEE